MDYSKLSDQELLALKNRDYSKLSDETLLSLKKSTPTEPSGGGVLSKINQGALNVAQTGLETLGAVAEVPGEVIRGIVETPQAPLSNFRAPSVVQRFAPSLRTKEPPAIGVDTLNKLIRGGAGAVDAAVKGENVMEGARKSYNADRGILGTVEDTAASLLLGKVPAGKTGTTIGDAPMVAFTEGVKDVASRLKNITKSVGKGVIRVGLGPKGEEQSLLFRNPAAVKGATNLPDLPAKVADNVNELAKKVEELDNHAWDSLLKLKAEPRSRIINALKAVRREFVGAGKTNVGDSDIGAVKQIDKYIERVKKIKQPGIDPKLDQMLDQPQLRNIVQSIRRDADFGLQGDPVNRASIMAQRKIDAMLKENGNYKEIMDELAPATRTLKESAKKLFLKKEDGKFVPTNTTFGKLRNATDKKKIDERKVIESLSKQTGTDVMGDIKASKAKASFGIGLSDDELRDNARGSARTLLGTILGSSLGGVFGGFGGGGAGGAVGALAGRGADVYGGTAAGKIIDLLRTANQSLSRTANSPVAKKVSGASSPLIELIRKLASNPAAVAALSRGSR